MPKAPTGRRAPSARDPAGDPAGDEVQRVLLRDGRVVSVRPVRSDDKPLFIEGFRRLSKDSRYLRFFAAKKTLSEPELSYLTEVDGDAHVAVGALDERGRGLGVARYVRLEHEPQVAEAAVTVVDEAQRQGLGHVLLERILNQARSANLRTLRFWVMARNTGMKHLLQDIGAECRLSEGPLQCYELDVSA